MPPPGWEAVYAYPVPLQNNLLDPVRFNEWSFHEIHMDDRWRQMEHTLQHFTFTRTLQGFRAQLPPRDDTYPRYLYQLWPDGLFEFGTLSEGAFRDEGRSIPSTRWSSTHTTLSCSSHASTSSSGTKAESRRPLVSTVSPGTRSRSTQPALGSNMIS